MLIEEAKCSSLIDQHVQECDFITMNVDAYTTCANQSVYACNLILQGLAAAKLSSLTSRTALGRLTLGKSLQVCPSVVVVVVVVPSRRAHPHAHCKFTNQKPQ